MSNCFSNTNIYKIGDRKFKIFKPKSWQVAANFIGTDLSLLGEVKNKRRPVIAFSSIPIGDYQFKKNDLEQSQEKYFIGRRDWVKKNKGTVNSFYSYLEVSWDNIRSVHSIGYNYKQGNVDFIEYTYFFKCNKETYNISTLVTTEQLKTSNTNINKILNSIQCL
jgi:hypothetical protein